MAMSAMALRVGHARQDAARFERIGLPRGKGRTSEKRDCRMYSSFKASRSSLAISKGRLQGQKRLV